MSPTFTQSRPSSLPAGAASITFPGPSGLSWTSWNTLATVMAKAVFLIVMSDPVASTREPAPTRGSPVAAVAVSANGPTGDDGELFARSEIVFVARSGPAAV